MGCEHLRDFIDKLANHVNPINKVKKEKKKDKECIKKSYKQPLQSPLHWRCSLRLTSLPQKKQSLASMSWFWVLN